MRCPTPQPPVQDSWLNGELRHALCGCSCRAWLPDRAVAGACLRWHARWRPRQGGEPCGHLPGSSCLNGLFDSCKEAAALPDSCRPSARLQAHACAEPGGGAGAAGCWGAAHWQGQPARDRWVGVGGGGVPVVVWLFCCLYMVWCGVVCVCVCVYCAWPVCVHACVFPCMCGPSLSSAFRAAPQHTTSLPACRPGHNRAEHPHRHAAQPAQPRPPHRRQQQRQRGAGGGGALPLCGW